MAAQWLGEFGDVHRARGRTYAAPIRSPCCSPRIYMPIKLPLEPTRWSGSLSELGSQALIFNDDEVVELLRAAVEREGSQVAFAKRHGIDRVYLNMVLNRKRPVGESIIKSLGLCVV